MVRDALDEAHPTAFVQVPVSAELVKSVIHLEHKAKVAELKAERMSKRVASMEPELREAQDARDRFESLYEALEERVALRSSLTPEQRGEMYEHVLSATAMDEIRSLKARVRHLSRVNVDQHERHSRLWSRMTRYGLHTFADHDSFAPATEKPEAAFAEGERVPIQKLADADTQWPQDRDILREDELGINSSMFWINPLAAKSDSDTDDTMSSPVGSDYSISASLKVDSDSDSEPQEGAEPTREQVLSKETKRLTAAVRELTEKESSLQAENRALRAVFDELREKRQFWLDMSLSSGDLKLTQSTLDRLNKGIGSTCTGPEGAVDAPGSPR